MQSIEKVEIEEIKRNSLMENGKLILDACCGSRMFWFDKYNPLALFVDKRSETLTAKDRGKTCKFTFIHQERHPPDKH